MFLENAVWQREEVVADHMTLFGQPFDLSRREWDGCRDGAFAINARDPGGYRPKVEGHGLRRHDQYGLPPDAGEVGKPDRAPLIHGLLPVLRRRRQRGLAHLVAFGVVVAEGAVGVHSLELPLNPLRCSDKRLHHGAYEGPLTGGIGERGEATHQRHVELADEPTVDLGTLVSRVERMQDATGVIKPLGKVLRRSEADGLIGNRHDGDEG